MKKAAIIIFLVILIDQISKIYVKLNFEYGDFINVFGWEKFQIYFIENPGMAYGMEFGGVTGKIVLSVLRWVIIIYLFFLFSKWLHNYKSNFFIIPAALILGGALGNIIDSTFYGLLFDRGTSFDKAFGDWVTYAGKAQLNFDGYAPVFQGVVVDMLHFPLIETTFPDWLPLLGGHEFKFFKPVFNIADSCITIGFVLFLLFWKKAFKKRNTYLN